jgi:hypothetical protein
MWRKRWLPLAAGIVLFAGSIAAYVWLYEGHPLRANPSDESVYYLAGRLIRSHPAELYNDLVGLTGNVKLPYTYTPFAALVFEAGTVFSWAVWKAGLIVVDLVLLPLIIGDLALPDSSRWKGIGIGIAAIAARRGEHLLGILVCGVTGLLVSPISWTHHWVWVVPGLAFMLTGSRRSRPWRAVGAVALLGLFLMWPMNHHLVNLPTSGRAGLVRIGSEMAASSDLGHLLRNLYVVTGLAVLVLAAVYLWLSGRAKEVDGTSAPVKGEGAVGGAQVPSTS